MASFGGGVYVAAVARLVVEIEDIGCSEWLGEKRAVCMRWNSGLGQSAFCSFFAGKSREQHCYFTSTQAHRVARVGLTFHWYFVK